MCIYAGALQATQHSRHDKILAVDVSANQLQAPDVSEETIPCNVWCNKNFFFDDVSTSTAEFVGVLSQNMLFSFQLCFLCLGFVAHVSWAVSIGHTCVL